jgi:hypothetical protein
MMGSIGDAIDAIDLMTGVIIGDTADPINLMLVIGVSANLLYGCERFHLQTVSFRPAMGHDAEILAPPVSHSAMMRHHMPP